MFLYLWPTRRITLIRLLICLDSNKIYSMKNRQGGFIGIIVLIIIGLALLKYFFNWSVFDAATSPQGHDTISYVRQVLNTIWLYLGTPVTFVWNQVAWPLIDMIWKNFGTFIQWGQHTASTPLK